MHAVRIIEVSLFEGFFKTHIDQTSVMSLSFRGMPNFISFDRGADMHPPSLLSAREVG
jgi:hypothetical protein